MARVHEPEVERPEGSEATRRFRLLSAVVATPALSTVAVVQAHSFLAVRTRSCGHRDHDLRRVPVDP
jgi:hypothetical protein